MSRSRLYSLLSHVHRTQHADANGLPDAELLERFARLRDEAAFELLVWRHERMVLGVCRRLLRDEHDAEDAFQAAFLTLARKAASIGRREAVASWLYKVAYRCALRLRESVHRQRQRVVCGVDPTGVAVPDSSLAEVEQRDLRELIDEEVQRLPAKYRAAIVLCYLEGKSYQKAADELGCPAGTLSARLHQARERLRRRLTARGVAPATALAVLEGVRETHAAARLAAVAVQAARRVVAGQSIADVVSFRTLEICTEVMQTMSASRPKIVAVLLLMGCLSGMMSWAVLRALPQAPREQSAASADKPEGRPSARPGAEAALTPERILEEALRTTEQVKDGNEGRLLEKIAAAQRKAGHRTVADKLFQQADQALEKTAAWRDARQKSFLLGMRAILLGESGDREAAHKAFQQALRIARSLDKGNGRIDMMQFLARQQGEVGELAEARETATEVQPDFYRDQVLADIALCQAKQGDIPGALAAADALGAFSRVTALAAIAAVQARRGERTAARTTLRKASELVGKSEKPLQPILLVRIALAQVSVENAAAAHRSLAKADALAKEMRVGFNLPYEMVQLAVAQAEQGDREGARQTLHETRQASQPGSEPDITALQIALGDLQSAYQSARQPGRSQPLHFWINTLPQIARVQAESGDAGGAYAWARQERIPSIRAFVLIGVAEGMLKRKETGRRSDAPRELLSVPTPKDVQAQPALPSPRHDQEYQALKAEFEAEKASDFFKVAAAYASRFLRLAQKYSDEPLAFDALEWIVEFARETPETRTALELLLRDHVTDRRMGRVCGLAIFSSFPKAAETLLRAVLEKNPDRRVQGHACLCLAQMLQARSQRIQGLRRAASPKLARHYEAVFGKDYLNALKSSDPTEVLHETEKFYERVLEKYADVKVNDLLLSEYAKRALFEIRNLAIGKPAPEIEGEDLDGKRFKLSDYRGQVVMLVFCGHWCSACRSLYPRERALVKKMEGRPFVLLEVNSDEDRDKAKKTREKEKLGWRAWWDRGTAGPISQHWNVSSWPTIYLLDANGVIRFKDFVEDMEGMVDGLLKEQAAKRAK